MSSMVALAAFSGKQSPPSWGWKHVLTWNHLSTLWNIQVDQYARNTISANPAIARACSIALAPGEFEDLSVFDQYFSSMPVVVFMNQYSLNIDKKPIFNTAALFKGADHYEHVFQVNKEHPLTTGLPSKVTVYGPLEAITPLASNTNMHVLVTLANQPIIGYCSPHLLIGASPWQLGAPSLPLVYPILRKWLEDIAGIRLPPKNAQAIIRLDDLPTTAEELLHRQPNTRLDLRRAIMLRRLRKFANRSKIHFTLMYTSHFYGKNGNLTKISEVMPRSIREIGIGIKQGVFEIGAHGMVHLRYPYARSKKENDPREFLDLDEESANEHLQACIEEIWRLLKVRPVSFVAPAWGYRTGVTKRTAGQKFKVIIDSSQHVESASSEVLFMAGEESPALNCTETFRAGSRMVSYSSPDFWRCYASAGIPVHYMQHTDTNWHLLKEFLGEQVQLSTLQPDSLNARLLTYLMHKEKPFLVRAMGAAWLGINNLWRKPASWGYLWKISTSSSLYSFIRALRRAGYQCTGLDQFNSSIVQKDQRIIQ
jgi:predicted deacetylase